MYVICINDLAITMILSCIILTELFVLHITGSNYATRNLFICYFIWTYAYVLHEGMYNLN